MKARLTYVLVVWAAVVVLPASGWAQQTNKERDGHRHGPPAASDAAVDFGVAPRQRRRSGRRPVCKPARSAVPPIRVPTCCIA